uniref:Uncharacterized protein n=1 Tax=Romanomermis culicivorax TaxID=13658 RepID=A0A915I6A3_ROMCU
YSYDSAPVLDCPNIGSGCDYPKLYDSDCGSLICGIQHQFLLLKYMNHYSSFAMLEYCKYRFRKPRNLLEFWNIGSDSKNLGTGKISLRSLTFSEYRFGL